MDLLVGFAAGCVVTLALVAFLAALGWPASVFVGEIGKRLRELAAKIGS